jgi:hypothetical protein
LFVPGALNDGTVEDPEKLPNRVPELAFDNEKLRAWLDIAEVKSGDRLPALVTTDDGKSVVAMPFHCGAADALPVPVWVRNSRVADMLPGKRAAVPPALPIIRSPVLVIGLLNPIAEIVICPATAVNVTPLP